MQLNEKQQYAFNQIALGKNVYVGGSAGVGKSVLIRRVKEQFGDDTVFLAPTGIAALNIQGATIHSQFKFPFSVLEKKHHKHFNKKTQELFHKDGPVKRIVIDEISMVRSDIFVAMDMQLRYMRRTNKPFGGLQIVCVGDFYQLPPVLTNKDKRVFNANYDGLFAFSNESWSSCNFEYIELTEIMRQSDATFIKHLMNVRTKNEHCGESIEFFNNHGLKNAPNVAEEDCTYLCAVNATVDMINREFYGELDEKEKVFYAYRNGNIKFAPVDEELRLKIGTRVILSANTDQFKNGETGYVAEFLEDGNVVVLMEQDESQIIVEPFKWEEAEYDIVGGKLHRNVLGVFEQLPIKLGWAQTVHKSQGQTILNAMIDPGRGFFAHGQAYVALSRIKTLEGLGLSTPLSFSDVIIDPQIQEFYDNDCRGIGLF